MFTEKVVQLIYVDSILPKPIVSSFNWLVVEGPESKRSLDTNCESTSMKLYFKGIYDFSDILYSFNSGASSAQQKL